MKNKASYDIVERESTPEVLVIRDMGPWNEYKTVTNAAEETVKELYEQGLLPNGRKLFYYDTENDKDELVHENGVFKGFRTGSPRWEFNVGGN